MESFSSSLETVRHGSKLSFLRRRLRAPAGLGSKSAKPQSNLRDGA